MTGGGSKTPRFVLVLSENWTMTGGRDLLALIRWAREALAIHRRSGRRRRLLP